MNSDNKRLILLFVSIMGLVIFAFGLVSIGMSPEFSQYFYANVAVSKANWKELIMIIVGYVIIRISAEME